MYLIKVLLLSVLFIKVCFAQKVNLHTVSFYNVENLFDIWDNPKKIDNDFTPEGSYAWTEKKYEKKLQYLSVVISQIGLKETQLMPTLVGLAEVENKGVLQDLISTKALKKAKYGIIHFESKDFRGIDVALLYREKLFKPINSKRYRLQLVNPKTQRKYYSRDILVVSGLLQGTEIHLLVNHWPSRRGGQKKSAPYRKQAQLLNNHIVDSLLKLERKARIINMGDFNDNPIDVSVSGLMTREKKKKPMFINPLKIDFKKGEGSLAYRDKWFLFDQILLTPNFEKRKNLFLLKASVFHPSFLINQSGRYKGYPFRTGKSSLDKMGYSDHFPVYVILASQIR